MNLSGASLDQIFKDLKHKRFAVLGDYCLDAYYFLDEGLSEVSIETGLNTLAVKSMRFSPGGAGNVAANLTAMGAAHVHALGVLGDDLYGREYLLSLARRGIGTDYLVVQTARWHTCVYSKLYHGEKELPRIDIGRANRLDPISAETLLAHLARLVPRVDVVLINQQLHNGIHGSALQAGLRKMIADHPEIVWLLDARDHIETYPGTIRKLNHLEAVCAAGLTGCRQDADRDADSNHETSVRHAADILFHRWGTPFCITRGSRGSLARDASGSRSLPGLHFTTKLDTVGAGDSIFAGLAAGLASGLDLPEALAFASLAAGVTIQKNFETGTASEQEIRTLARDPDYRYFPEKAATPATAVFHSESEIEMVGEMPLGAAISCALFDHDGTLSTLREGWEAVMAPMMVRAILGHDPDPGNAAPDLQAEIAAEVAQFINQTTGLRTLVQMEGLVELIRSRGLVPPGEILDPKEYKRLYLQELHGSVHQRLAKVARRERDPADYTIKGSVAFLKELRHRGVKLFLASGTDETHLRPEAAAMGYAELFDGGIYGAWDHTAEEPKKVVLGKILAQMNGAAPGAFVTFGDGPVEMRETLKRGGIGVGVASDEVRRYGLNSIKRERLILAGAHVIIPDYAQGKKLLALLFPGA